MARALGSNGKARPFGFFCQDRCADMTALRRFRQRAAEGKFHLVMLGRRRFAKVTKNIKRKSGTNLYVIFIVGARLVRLANGAADALRQPNECDHVPEY